MHKAVAVRLRKVFKPSNPISDAKGVGIGKIVVFTMCPVGGCPRMIVNGKNTVLRDDYKGSAKISTKLLAKLSVVR